MTPVWNWIKYNLGYVYFTLFLTIAAIGYAQDGWTTWTWVDIGAAVLFLFLYQCPKAPFYRDRQANGYAKGGTIPPPRTFEEGEVQVLLSKGSVEPIDPQPFAHAVENCVICKRAKMLRDNQ